MYNSIEGEGVREIEELVRLSICICDGAIFITKGLTDASTIHEIESSLLALVTVGIPLLKVISNLWNRSKYKFRVGEELVGK